MATDRLSELETSWTRIQTAHTQSPEGATAMRELISRYHDAVEHYLRLKLKDPHLADEVMQDFWTKVMEHKLANADRTKGRFRDYLRTVLHRLIIDQFRGRKLQALPPGDLLDPSEPDQDYDHVWREAVLKRARTRLETYEAVTPNNRYASVLNLRVERPDAPIEEIAADLSKRLGQAVSCEAFRKTLQRARAKFLELLIEELRATIHPCTDDDVEAEMQDLGLGNLYRKYVQLGRNN